MKFLQYNIQSLQKNKQELHRVLLDSKYDVALLTETWTKPGEEGDKKYLISQYHSVLKSRMDGYGGAGILLKRSYNYINLDLRLQSNMIQCVAIRIPSKNLVIASVYAPPSVTAPELESDLNSLTLQLQAFRRVIISGDFNCHHILWGNEKCDRKGEEFLNVINGANLLILNDGSKTYFPAEVGKKPSAIDITLSSADIFGELEWKVQQSTIGGSSHLIIEFEMITEGRKEHKFINRKKVNEEIAKLEFTEGQGTDELKAEVRKIIKKNYKKSRFIPKIWWSSKTEEAWKEKNEARRKFNENSTIENCLAFKKASAIFLRLKREGTKEAIENLANSIDPQTSSKELWAKIGRITGKRVYRRENNMVQEDEDMAQRFLDLHFGKSEVDVDVPILGGPVCNYNIMNEETWERILNKKKSTSAPAEDKISFEILKALSPSVRNSIIREVNEMFIGGHLRDHLKEIKVVAIPKANKDQATVEGKRPISLVPTITKLVNSAVLEKVTDFLDEKKILPKTSFGFRRHTSTVSCVNYLVNCIKENKRSNFKTAALFLDLSNAFNTVKVEKLEEILVSLQFPLELTTWIVSFLKNRRICMLVNNKPVTRTISNGLPQGDVLSPTLFNIYTQQLHEGFDECGDVILIQFADDFAIVWRSRTLTGLKQKGQEYLDKFIDQAENLNLQINPNKTKTVLFQLGDATLDLKIRGSPIETVQSHKYLGVFIDRSLSFGMHTRDVCHRVAERINMIKIISNIRSGGHPQSMLLVYQALVRSIVEYCSSAFNNCASTYKEKIQRTLNQALRRATGCSKTTPINTLLAISAQMPWKIRSNYIAGREIAKHTAYRNAVYEQLNGAIDNDWPTDCLTFIEKQYIQNIDLFSNIYPIMRVFNPIDDVEIESQLENSTLTKNNCSETALRQSALFTMNGKYRDRPRVFTDASRYENTCAIGVYIEFSKTRIAEKLQNPTSIMTAELLAIQKATELLEQMEVMNAVIFTDSKSSCETLLRSKNAKYRSVPEEEILQRCSRFRIAVQWIPSHVGLGGNEIADTLAKEGLNREQVVDNKILLDDAYLQLKEISMKESNDWYSEYSQEKGKKFFAIQDTFQAKPWFHKTTLNKDEVRTLNRILAGHDYSKYWLHKMKIEEDECCYLCQEPETAEHLILHCPRFNNSRASFSFDGMFLNLIDLLKKKDVTLLKEVVQFVKICKINI